MALNRVDCPGNGIGCTQIAKPPTGHSVRFAESIYRDGQVVVFPAERRDAEMLHTIVKQLFIDFIRQDQYLLLGGDVCDFLKFLFRINSSGWIARTVNNNHFGARRHCILKFFRRQLPIIFLFGLDEYRVCAG